MMKKFKKKKLKTNIKKIIKKRRKKFVAQGMK